MIKLYALVASCLLVLSACTAQTQLLQHGNSWVQVSQTTNQWDSNAVVVTVCDTLQNGFCPESAPSQIVVMNGPMPGIAGAGVSSAAMLGSAFVIADGLKGSKSTIKQSNRTDVRASTVNPR